MLATSFRHVPTLLLFAVVVVHGVMAAPAVHADACGSDDYFCCTHYLSHAQRC